MIINNPKAKKIKECVCSAEQFPAMKNSGWKEGPLPAKKETKAAKPAETDKEK